MNYDDWAAIGHANGWLGVRRNDKATSKAGAQAMMVRSGSQRAKLLFWYSLDGLTDDEAGRYSGLAKLPKCCYWKRCSELRQAGYIAPTGETRRSLAGIEQQVCEITLEGRQVLDALA